MTKIKHFSLANKSGESLEGYLHRLADEIGRVTNSGAKILDVIIDQPNSNLNEEQIVSTVYLADSGSDDKHFDMERHVEYTSADSSTSALVASTTNLQKWIGQNPNTEIYDIKYTLGVTSESKDIAEATIYYS